MNHLHQQLAEQGEKSSGGFSVAGRPERALAKGLLVGLLVLCRPLLVLPLAVQLELAVHASADRLAGRAGLDLPALASLVIIGSFGLCWGCGQFGNVLPALDSLANVESLPALGSLAIH